MSVDRNGKKSQTPSIRKRTPLEQAIAEKTDRRIRYESSMKDKGLKKTTMWSREDTLSAIQTLNRLMAGEKGDEIASRFREFVAQQGVGA